MITQDCNNSVYVIMACPWGRNLLIRMGGRGEGEGADG